LRSGILLAAVVTTPSLWPMVQAGTLDSTAALQRAGIVAGACVVGLTLIDRLIVGYHEESEAARVADARESARTSAQAADSSGGPGDAGTPARDGSSGDRSG
jgi:hypothetical protein